MTTQAPAWGTPPPATSVSRFTVVGFYGYNGQRFCQHVTALSARDAEDLVRREYGSQSADDGSPCDLQVCGVLAVVDGRIVALDGYAVYLDPDLRDSEMF